MSVSIGGRCPPTTPIRSAFPASLLGGDASRRLRAAPAVLALRRCPPLTPLVILVTGLALLAPSAFAHGNQFVGAKLTIGEGGAVALELTADHGDNPNISDATEARQVLRECLQVCIGDERYPLEEFGALTFSEHQAYGADSPVPSSPEAGPHRLVTASWRANLAGQRVVFAAKERTPLDVVLWRADGQPLSKAGRWTLLIAGDRSTEFIMTPASLRLPFWSAALLLLPLMPFIWQRLRRPVPMGDAISSADRTACR